MHWEEKFCEKNGVCWEKLVDTKRFLPQYSDITGWDDSAGKDAFENAKARYWAQINGLQPEIPLPDPDLLIDTIDHDAPPSDNKLYQNLQGSLSDGEGDDDDFTSDEWGEGGVILWDSHYRKEEIEEEGWGNIQTGWGEGENNPIIPTGWGDIPMQPTVQPDGWGVIQGNWGDNLVNQTRWADVTGDANPGTTYEGIVPTGWGEVEAGPRVSWNGGTTDASYWSCGVNEGEWGGWNQSNGYNYSVPVAGQYWNYGGNFWNSSGLNVENWNNYNQNCWNYTGEQRGYKSGWNRNGVGRSGWTKSGNKNNNKGKEWRKKEDSSCNFCAPLNQPNSSNGGWNVPRSVA